jgi:hypothetical protein
MGGPKRCYVWRKVAKFAGSKYAVSIDCSYMVFLSLKYLQHIGELNTVLNLKYLKWLMCQHLCKL